METTKPGKHGTLHLHEITYTDRPERDAVSTETKHTPGPWVVEVLVPSVVRVRDSQGDIVSLMSCESDDGEAVGAINADARIIAAAPELLEALKAAAKALDYYEPQSATWFAARAAIAKAEGR